MQPDQLTMPERATGAVPPDGPTTRAKRFRLLPSRVLVPAGDGDDVDEAETSDGIDVMRADEPGADETHPDPFHETSFESFESFESFD